MAIEKLQYIEEEIDLRHYLGLLRRHMKILAGASVIVASLAAIYAFKMPNIFRAEGQILIEREEQPTPYVELRNTNLMGNVDLIYYNTQLEILKSYDFLRKTLKGYQLWLPILESRKIRVIGDTPEEEHLKIAIGIVRNGLNIQRIKDTRIFTIAFKSTNPVLCKELVNAMSRVYIKQNIEQKLYVPKELLQFFPDDARTIQEQTAYGQLKQVSDQELGKTLPSVVNDPLIRQLQSKAAEAEANYRRLKEAYKEKHPKVIEAKSNLKFIRDRIKIESENIIRNLKATLSSQLRVSNVRILKDAEVPQDPAGPKRLQIILMAFLIAFSFISVTIFVIDFLDDTIKNQEDIENFVQLPFLGHVPLFKEKITDVHQKAFWVHYNPLSDISECFRFIKVAINFSGAPGTLKCLLITSAVPAEGKSLVAANLVSSFLRDSEKVLVVDADLRHPTIHLLTNTENVKGLSHYLASNIEFSDVVQKTTIPQLDVVTAGPLSPNPTELFSSYRMENFIREAKSKYDRIIIDSPPVIGLADSIVIGTKCDGVMFLIQARHVSRNLVKKAKQRLLETGVKILGIIINKLDVEREDPSYRYYTQGYYYYSGRKSEKTEDKDSQSSKG